MVESIQAFAECCYIARRNAITSTDLSAFEEHLKRFHNLRHIFIETGVRTSISLPRQHSLMHYKSKIERFGSPNGVCSSITESTHITAVKKPWRRSNHNNALPQMMRTISRLYKLNALRQVFKNRGMLDGKLSDYARALVSGDLPAIRPYGQYVDTIQHETEEDDDDGGPLPGTNATAQVTLGLTRSGY